MPQIDKNYDPYDGQLVRGFLPSSHMLTGILKLDVLNRVSHKQIGRLLPDNPAFLT